MSKPLACCPGNLVLLYQEVQEGDFAWIWRCPHCGYWHYATTTEIEVYQSQCSEDELQDQEDLL